MGTTSKRYSAEGRERAVRMVGEHRGQYGSQLGSDPVDRRQDRLHERVFTTLVQQAERDEGKRAGYRGRYAQ